MCQRKMIKWKPAVIFGYHVMCSLHDGWTMDIYHWSTVNLPFRKIFSCLVHLVHAEHEWDVREKKRTHATVTKRTYSSFLCWQTQIQLPVYSLQTPLVPMFISEHTMYNMHYLFLHPGMLWIVTIIKV